MQRDETYLDRLLDRTRPVHAEAIVPPERAFPVQVDLVVPEEGMGDEAMQCGKQVVVERLDSLVCAIGRLDGPAWLDNVSAKVGV